MGPERLQYMMGRDSEQGTATTASDALANITSHSSESTDTPSITRRNIKADNPVARAIGIGAVIIAPHAGVSFPDVNKAAAEMMRANLDAATSITDPNVAAPSLNEYLMMSPTPIVEQSEVPPTPVSTLTPETNVPNTVTPESILTIKSVDGTESLTDLGVNLENVRTVFDYLVQTGFPPETFNGNALEFLSGFDEGKGFIFRQKVDVPQNGEPIGTQNVPINERGSVIVGKVNNEGNLQLLFMGPGQTADEINRKGGEIDPSEATFNSTVNGYLNLVISENETAGIIDLNAAFANEESLLVFETPADGEPNNINISQKLIQFPDGSSFTVNTESDGSRLVVLSVEKVEATITPVSGVEIAVFIYDPTSGGFTVDHRLSGVPHTIEPTAVTPDGKLVFSENGQTFFVTGSNTNLSIDQINKLPVFDPQTGTVESILSSYEYLRPDTEISVISRDGKDLLVIDGTEYPTEQLKIEGRDVTSGLTVENLNIGGSEVVATVGYAVGFENSGAIVNTIDQHGKLAQEEIGVVLVMAVQWPDGTWHLKEVPFSKDQSQVFIQKSDGQTSSQIASNETLVKTIKPGKELKVYSPDLSVDQIQQWELQVNGYDWTPEQKQQSLDYLQHTWDLALAFPNAEDSILQQYKSNQPPDSSIRLQGGTATLIIYSS